MSQNHRISNKGIRLILHCFYFVTAIAYVLAGQLDVDELRIFKVIPLALLILLLLPLKFDKNVVKIIFGIIAGAIGDEVL